MGLMSMGDCLRDKQQEARNIPEGHCPAESASKEPKGCGLSREIELGRPNLP